MTDWGHVVEISTAVITAATGGSVPVLLYIMANKKQAKKDADARHEEQQKLINGLLIENKFFPAHRHNEKAGVLSRENIDFPSD